MVIFDSPQQVRARRGLPIVRAMVLGGLLACFGSAVGAQSAPLHESGDAPAAGESPEVQYRREIVGMLDERQFDRLEETAQALKREDSKLPTGQSKIRMYYRALSQTAPGEGIERSDELIGLLQDWKRAHPQSLTPRIALVNAYLQYGWLQPQDSLARKLSLTGELRIGAMLEKAAGELDEAERLAQGSQLQEIELIRARMLLYRRQAVFADRMVADGEIIDLMKQGLALDPQNGSVVASAALFFLSRAGDNPHRLTQLADEVLELTRQRAGHAHYATIVFETWPYYGNRLFQHFGFSWEKTAQGFRDQLAQNPHATSIKNRFCLLATIAGDRETAHQLFTELGDHWDRGLWQTEAYYESRKRWAHPDSLSGMQRAVFEGHSGAVMSVAYSHDGSRVATGGTDRRVVIRDANTGQEQATLQTPHRRAVTSLAFSPDDAALATTGYDNTVQMWDLATLQPRPLGTHRQSVRRLAYSNDGTLVASACSDGSIGLWPVSGNAAHRPISSAHQNGVYGVAFSPDGTRLASVGGDGRIKVWDVATRKIIHNVVAHEHWASAVCWSTDGTSMATAGADRLVKLWDAATVQEAGILRGANHVVYDVAFSTEMSLVLGVSMDTANSGKPGEVLIWNRATHKLINALKGHKGAVWSCAFSPDGTTAATVSNDGTLRLWNVP